MPTKIPHKPASIPFKRAPLSSRGPGGEEEPAEDHVHSKKIGLDINGVIMSNENVLVGADAFVRELLKLVGESNIYVLSKVRGPKEDEDNKHWKDLKRLFVEPLFHGDQRKVHDFMEHVHANRWDKGEQAARYGLAIFVDDDLKNLEDVHWHAQGPVLLVWYTNPHHTNKGSRHPTPRQRELIRSGVLVEARTYHRALESIKAYLE